MGIKKIRTYLGRSGAMTAIERGRSFELLVGRVMGPSRCTPEGASMGKTLRGSVLSIQATSADRS